MDMYKTEVSLVIDAMPQGCTAVQWVDREGSYEGDGALIYLTPEGKYGAITYSHCSCDDAMGTRYICPVEDTYELARRHIGESLLEDLPVLFNEYGESHA